jgi:hypothetical protein
MFRRNNVKSFIGKIFLLGETYLRRRKTIIDKCDEYQASYIMLA